MNNTSNKRKLIIIFVAIALVGVVVFALLKSSVGQKPSTVVISNLQSCSKNINPVVVEEIQKGSYALVNSANNYNKVPTSKSYKASIRSGSCKQTQEKNVRGYGGEQINVKTTDIILDIPDARQSWKITYDWVTGSQKVDTDLGSIQPSCLPQDQLVYGEFKCENVLSLARFGTDKPDPILQYMPYSGAGFTLDYDPDTKLVSVAFDPPPGTTDVPAFIQNIKDIIPYWFQKRGLDQSKYKIVYSDQVDSPDDNQQ